MNRDPVEDVIWLLILALILFTAWVFYFVYKDTVYHKKIEQIATDRLHSGAQINQ